MSRSFRSSILFLLAASTNAAKFTSAISEMDVDVTHCPTCASPTMATVSYYPLPPGMSVRFRERVTSKARFVRAYRLVVLGSGAVGKSALTIQFVRGKFVDEWDPTIEDTYRKPQIISNEVVMLDVIDTSGIEAYRPMHKSQIASGEGFILVYSVTSRLSFRELRSFHRQILQTKDQKTIPIVLVANKCDLEYQRQVSRSEGRELARLFGCKLIETSAKYRINVDEAFGECMREVRESMTVESWRDSSAGFKFTKNYEHCENNDDSSLACVVL